MTRLRAVAEIASAIGSFRAGQVFDMDDEHVARAWLAAGVAVEAPAPEAPEPVAVAADPDAPTAEDMRAAVEKIEQLAAEVDTERAAHEVTMKALEKATAELEQLRTPPATPAPPVVETATAPAPERAAPPSGRVKPSVPVSGK